MLDSLNMNAMVFRLLLRHVLFVTSCLLFFTAAQASAKSYQINVDDWARPRSGSALVQFPALKELVNDWSLSKNGTVEIYYPGGEMGGLWVDELTDWLVSLGVPSENIVKRSGSGTMDRIELTIIK